MEDKDSKEVDGSEVIKVYIFKAEADDDLGKCLTMSIPKTLYFQKITIKVMVITSWIFTFPGGTEVITEDDYQNGHPDLEAASSGRLGVGRDKMVYMAVKNPPKEEEEDDDNDSDEEDDEIGMFFVFFRTVLSICILGVSLLNKTKNQNLLVVETQCKNKIF